MAPLNLDKHEEWSDAKFLVEAIIADFNQIHELHLEMSFEKRAALGLTTEGPIAETLKSMLSRWATEKLDKDETPFMCGATKIPLDISDFHLYPLRPIESTFSVTKEFYDGKYNRGCINILLQIEGHPLVDSPRAGKFEKCLCSVDHMSLTISSDASRISAAPWKELETNILPNVMPKLFILPGYAGGSQTFKKAWSIEWTKEADGHYSARLDGSSFSNTTYESIVVEKEYAGIVSAFHHPHFTTFEDSKLRVVRRVIELQQVLDDFQNEHSYSRILTL